MVFVAICLFSLLCLSCTKKAEVERPFVRYMIDGGASPKILISTEDQFDLHSGTKTIKNPKAGIERVSPITGHTLPYKRTYKYTGGELTDSMKYGAMDIYETDDESVGFLYNSDLLAFYYDTVGHTAQRERIIGDDELTGIAKGFLDTWFEDGWDDQMVPAVQTRQGSACYDVSFKRYAFEYSLFDYISVTINGEGKVVGMNGSKFGILKGFETHYTKEEIEAAYEAVIEKLKSFEVNIVRTTPSIQANPKGEAFLVVSVSSRDPDKNGNVYDAIDVIATPIRVPTE